MFVSSPEFDAVLRGLLLAMLALSWAVALVRINGLRSLSKMTNFDFIMTIALGSLIANAAQAADWREWLQPVAGMAGLFLLQHLAGRLRNSSERIEDMLQNNPVILMRDGEIIREALKATRVPENDLVAKLREANVLDLSEVRAVVLETTGDISVLHGNKLEETLLKGVKTL